MKIFKRFYAGIILCFAFAGVYAQGVSVNNSGATSDPSAILDISSPDLGILVPRIALTDTADASTIPSPAHSLLVFNTSLTGGLVEGYYYNEGTAVFPHWVEFMPNPMNQNFNMAGNKIVNLATCTDDHDAANKAYVDMVAGGGGGGGSTGCCDPTSGATELSNPSLATMNYIAACVYCDTLTEGGHTDWYLPSLSEINYLLVLAPSTIDLTDNKYFWTSKAYPDYAAYTYFRFNTPYVNITGPNGNYYAKCARK